MKRGYIYVIYYLQTILALIISIFLAYLLGIALVYLLELLFGLDYSFILLATIACPIVIFCFQILQDMNYYRIHQFGYWAYPVREYDYNGGGPRFYPREQQKPSLLVNIKKAKYRYRLFGIMQWVIVGTAIELMLWLEVLLTKQYQLKAHFLSNPLWAFLPLFVGWIAFRCWGKLQKLFKLKVAYVENEREFYYRQM